MPSRLLAWFTLVLLVAGCAARYSPDRGAPTAELIVSSNLADDPFRDGGSGDPAANQNTFLAFADAGCEQELGYLAAYANHDGARETVHVEAGRRLHILVRWANQARIDASQVAQQSCHNLVSFVPEAGEDYEVEQEIVRREIGARAQCRAVVRTFAGRGPTRSFQDHPLQGKCAALTKGG